MNPEILIYLQQIKMYINSNQVVKDYFIGEFKEDIFYERLKEVSLINYNNTDDPKLNREQFESIRMSIIVSSRQVVTESELFFEIPGFGSICKN
jgi:hypothetical protein